jgi:prolyl oligopeptidase
MKFFSLFFVDNTLLKFAIIIGFVFRTVAAQNINYPISRKADKIDDYFGVKVADPYVWLEDDNAPEVKEWVKAQNKVTFDYLSRIPFRDKIKKRLSKVMNYPKMSAPFKKGKWYFQWQNSGLQNQPILYYAENKPENWKVFLDPNELSKEGTVSVGNLVFSYDNKYLAYTVSQAGSDWSTLHIKEVPTGRVLSDKLEWIKFSGAAWVKSEGFYYSRYDEPKTGKELSAQNQFQKIYYHKVGTPQASDELIFADSLHPLRYYTPNTSKDGRWLIINISEGTSGDEMVIKDRNNANKEPVTIGKGFSSNYQFIEAIGDDFYFYTDYKAPFYRLVKINYFKPDEANWQEIIPEKKEILESVSIADNRFFASYLRDACSRIVEMEKSGKVIREVRLPTFGTATGFRSDEGQSEFYYTFESFAYPPEIYKYEMKTGISTLFFRSKIDFNPEKYETELVFFNSKVDGKKVPIFLVYKKGIKKEGNTPTLLYGYGGFNISLKPTFSISNLPLLENGGIYAQVILRGGGEYGEEWHKAGMLEKKQHVFDDFIGAAEYLIENKYTSSEKLAIYGRSNGGLLVGACMTQRPELFKVTFPAVGVLDMLKYHLFTVGWGWAVEYGSSKNKEQFDFLIKYSPLHNLKSGTEYPATMIMTADHDDRVVPAHSFKFAAALQEANKGKNPTLIRIETDAGHGAGKPISKIIEDLTDFWSFMFYNVGFEPNY